MGRLGQWNENQILFSRVTRPGLFAHDHIGQAGHGRRLGTNSVATTSITNLAVTTGKINNLAVTSGKLGASAAIRSKIADNAAHRRKMGSGAFRWGVVGATSRYKVYFARANVRHATYGTSVHGITQITSFFGQIVTPSGRLGAGATNLGASQLSATQVRYLINVGHATMKISYCICGFGGA